MVARPRDHRAEYARLKIEAAKRGMSVRQYRIIRKANRMSDRTLAERKARRHAEYLRLKARAAARGRTVRQEKSHRRELARSGVGSPQAVALAHFGATRQEFEFMRAENREHNMDPATIKLMDTLQKNKRKKMTYVQRLNIFDESRDVEGDWSLARVGYVVTFYHAIVDPRTDYEAFRETNKTPAEAENISRWQASYVGRYAYGDIDDSVDAYMDALGEETDAEFEARYGEIYY